MPRRVLALPNGMRAIGIRHHGKRLVLLDEGKMFQDGSPEEVLQKEHLEKVYGVKVHLIRDHDGDIIISPDTLCMQ